MKELNANSLKRTNVSDQIFEILKEKINTGVWKVGEKIPSETEIASLFLVSRMSARTAIQRLSAVGLVEVRVGEGSFVKEYNPADAFSEVAGKMYHPSMSNDLREFRIGFDRMVMARACAVRTDEDLAKVHEIYAEMEKAAYENDLAKFNEEDQRFHAAIIQMTDNSVFSLVGSMLQELIRMHLEESTQKYKQMYSMEYNESNQYLIGLCEEHSYYLKSLEEKNPRIILDRLEPILERYDTL